MMHAGHSMASVITPDVVVAVTAQPAGTVAAQPQTTAAVNAAAAAAAAAAAVTQPDAARHAATTTAQLAPPQGAPTAVAAQPTAEVVETPVKLPKRKLPYNSTRRKNPDWDADAVIHLFLKAVDEQNVLSRNTAKAWEDVRDHLHKTELFAGKRISANSLQRRLAVVMQNTQKRQQLRLAKEACGIEDVAAPWHALAERLYRERVRGKRGKAGSRGQTLRKEVLDKFAQRLTQAVFTQVRTGSEVKRADVKAHAVAELKDEYPELDVEEIVRQHTEMLRRRQADARLGLATAAATGGTMAAPVEDLTGAKRKAGNGGLSQVVLKRRRGWQPGTQVEDVTTKMAASMEALQELTQIRRNNEAMLQRAMDELPNRIAAAVMHALGPHLQK